MRVMQSEARKRWVVACFTIPAEPSALRVATWRTLKQLGAAPLANAVYALPDREDLRAAMTRLVDRLNASGATALLLVAETLNDEDEQKVLDRLTSARSGDYAQVVKSARHFVEHVDRETATDDFRFAEVESLEEELEKVRRQFKRVIERDYFESPAQEEARAALLAAGNRLALYVEAASERGEE